MQVLDKPKRTRRTHSEAFKQQVIEASKAPGVSVAATALAHGINANQLRRWMRERSAFTVPVPRQEIRPDIHTPSAPNFVPLRPAEPIQSAAALPAIQIEVRRAGSVMKIQWPGELAYACVSWLQESTR